MAKVTRPVVARVLSAQAVAVGGEPAVRAVAEPADGGPRREPPEPGEGREDRDERGQGVVAAGQPAGRVDHVHLPAEVGVRDLRVAGDGVAVVDVDELDRGGRAEAADALSPAAADAAAAVETEVAGEPSAAAAGMGGSIAARRRGWESVLSRAKTGVLKAAPDRPIF